MEDNVVNETIEPSVDDFYNDVEEASGINKMVLGAGACLAGIAGGIIYKNREKIASAFADVKEKHRQKKVKACMDRLAKLEAKAPKPEETEEK